jgi:dTDP-4-amino-4,6-dideoxygalactose transaminase
MGFSTPRVPTECESNYHAYYVVLNNIAQRTQIIADMKTDGVQLASHYSSLHASAYFRSRHDQRALPNSDRYSECLVRLPLHGCLSTAEVAYVCERLLFHLGRLQRSSLS